MKIFSRKAVAWLPLIFAAVFGLVLVIMSKGMETPNWVHVAAPGMVCNLSAFEPERQRCHMIFAMEGNAGAGFDREYVRYMGAYAGGDVFPVRTDPNCQCPSSMLYACAPKDSSTLTDTYSIILSPVADSGFRKKCFILANYFGVRTEVLQIR